VEAEVGGGVPALVMGASGGWLALLDGEGRLLLAPLAPSGEILGTLGREPAIGYAQPLALGPQGLHVGKPIGKGVDLLLVRCR
jgi:hypothetical protein